MKRIFAPEPEAIVASAFEHTRTLDTIVSNDHFPAPAHPAESAPITTLRDNYTALLELPFRLIQAALPRLRMQSAANIVMVTSNRARLPHSSAKPRA